ncbi:MAG: hypothetical protein LBU62_04755 [Bacteroidales bacterium]|jgi:hypothetical protein|nr:hypothetical protein [Bacteroidales bacterium]
MQIANPIYDVVFKFMMEDSKVAKKFISAMQRNMQDEDFFFEPMKENVRENETLKKTVTELKSELEDKDRLIAELKKKLNSNL